MNKEPYILFLPKWYPCRNMALSGIFIQRHARSVSSLIGVVVLYAVYDEKLKHTWYERQEELKNGVWTVRYYYKKDISGFRLLDKGLKFLIYFFCLLQGYRYISRIKGKPALIHVHVLLRTGIFAWLCRLFLNINYIVSEHWSGYLKECNAYHGFFRKKFSEFIIRRASAVSTVSEALKNAMLFHKLKNQYSVIPNVVDTDKFLCKPSPHGRKIKVICIADFRDEVKNISAVLKAVRRISERRKDFELILVGEGPDENNYRRFCEGNNLLNRVVFIKGYVSPELVPDLICGSDFLLLYSHFETQGTVLLEAMSCGKPVLAAEAGGMKELVNEERGLLVKPGNDRDLDDKLNFMLDNYSKYDAVAIRKYVLNNFSDRIVSKKFYDLYLAAGALEKE